MARKEETEEMGEMGETEKVEEMAETETVTAIIITTTIILWMTKLKIHQMFHIKNRQLCNHPVQVWFKTKLTSIISTQRSHNCQKFNIIEKQTHQSFHRQYQEHKEWTKWILHFICLPANFYFFLSFKIDCQFYMLFSIHREHSIW